MRKITEKLYFFTKLSSSIVLFAIIIVLLGLFYKSYKSLEENSEKVINEKIDNNNIINDQIKDTNLLLSDLIKKIDIIEKEINSIKKNNESLSDNKLNEEIDKLYKKIDELSKVDFIKKENNELNKLNENQGIVLSEYYNILNLSLEKGINFSDTLEELLTLTDNDFEKSNLEKLLIISYDNILSFDELNYNFDISTNAFLKNYLISKSEYSYFIKLFLKFFSLRPDTQKNIYDENIKRVSFAKNHLNNKDIDKALNEINKLNNKYDHFNNWIKEANKYAESYNLILRAQENNLKS